MIWRRQHKCIYQSVYSLFFTQVSSFIGWTGSFPAIQTIHTSSFNIAPLQTLPKGWNLSWFILNWFLLFLLFLLWNVVWLFALALLWFATRSGPFCRVHPVTPLLLSSLKLRVGPGSDVNPVRDISSPRPGLAQVHSAVCCVLKPHLVIGLDRSGREGPGCHA